MKTLKKTEFELSLFEAFGIPVTAEDRLYAVLPWTWFVKTPLLGVKKLFYVEEAFDCDDFCRVLEYEWLMRHTKKAWAGCSDNGVSCYPALPIGRVKIETTSGEYHWVCFAACEDQVHLFERTAGGVTTYQRSNVKRYIQAIA